MAVVRAQEDHAVVLGRACGRVHGYLGQLKPAEGSSGRLRRGGRARPRPSCFVKVDFPSSTEEWESAELIVLRDQSLHLTTPASSIAYIL